jgi:hypothetical protein
LLSLADILAALRHACGQAKTLRDRPARLPKVLRGTAKVLRFSEHLAEEDGNTIIIQKAFSSRDNAEGARDGLHYGGFPREDIAIV